MSINTNGEERDKKLSSANLAKESIESLHPIEKNILSILYYTKGKLITDNELTKESDLSIDQIRRGIEWLKFKNFIMVEDGVESVISLKESPLKNDNYLLPERKLVNCVKEGKSDIVDIIKSEAFSNNSKEVYSAIKYCKNNKWIDFKNNYLSLLPGWESLSNEEKFIDKLIRLGSLTLSKLNESEISSFEILKKDQTL